MKQTIKTGELKEFITKLKKDGYKVYVPKEITTYCHFVKDDKIGFVERGDFGFNFSSVHKPNRVCGTGFQIHGEVYSPTTKHAKDCLCCVPSWASTRDIDNVVKYKDWNEYISKEINMIIEKVEV